MLLADHGAEVIRLEGSATGPDAGTPGPVEPGAVAWSRGKRHLQVAGAVMNSPELPGLLAGADMCLVDRPAEELAGTALDPGGVAERWPSLVLVHLGPFTASAPWAGGQPSEALAWAASGLATRQASFGGGPIELIVPILTVVQAVWSSAAAVAALIERLSSARGQVVTVGAAHAAAVAGAAAYTFDCAGPEPAVEGPRVGGPGGAVPFYRTYRCADGQWLFLAALTPRFTQLAFAVLGVEDLESDPRLEGGGRAAMLRPVNSAWIIERLAERFAQRPRSEWLEALAAAGCPAGPLLERSGWLDHPQVAAIGMRADIDDDHRGRVVAPGSPLTMPASPARIRGPEWGGPAAWSERQTRPPVGRASSDLAPAAAGQGPLRGVRVLDLGAIIAGPFAGSLLAELGADVIKVEPPAGDSFRGPGFAAYNKGQRGVVLDLQSQAGREALLALVTRADIVIDNYRPGVLERLRLDYRHLVEVNPDIITLTITGFGSAGPLGREPGFDPVLQAMSGMMTAQGGDSDPVFMTVPVNDVTTAALAALGCALALFHRLRGGGGQPVSTSLAAAATLLQSPDLIRYANRPPPRTGGRDHRGGPSGAFHRTADGWVRIETGPHDGPIGTSHGLDLAALPTPIAWARLTEAGVPAAVVTTPAGLAAQPDIEAAELLHRDPRPDRSSWRTAGRLARFTRTERTDTLVAPSLGEHTAEVLAEVGLSLEMLSHPSG